MKMLSAKQLMNVGFLGNDASYHAGGAESATYLNEPIMEKIYTNIHDALGEKASKSYVNMVAGLNFVSNDMRAATFITTLYALEAQNWIYSSAVLPKGDEAEGGFSQLAEDDNELAKLVLTGMMIRPQMNQATAQRTRQQILGNFLTHHHNEISDELKSAYPIARL